MHRTTLILECTDEDLRQAGRLIREGELVVFPTETVYGLGANALDPAASRKIFQAKGRPADNPLIIHVSSVEEISKYTRTLTETHWNLMKRCMPGPVTFVVPKAPSIPDIVTGGLSTVAIRIPALEEARILIQYAGVPIAAPSANRSGEPSPTTFDMAYHAMAGRVAAIVKGRMCEVGLESSVVRIEGNRLELLRPGYVSFETLLSLGKEFGLKTVDLSRSGHEKPVSPGLKYTHYKPKATVFLFSRLEDLIPLPSSILPPSRILCTAQPDSNEILQGILSGDTDMVRFNDLFEYARNLFLEFHRADAEGIRTILAWYPPPEGIGLAIGNRLIKASGGKFV